MGGRHSFSLRSLYEDRGLKHCQGWLRWLRYQDICYPTTPSAASPFLFYGFRYFLRFSSKGQTLEWRCHSVQTGGAVTSCWPACVQSWTPDGGIICRHRLSPFPQDEIHVPCYERLVSS